MTTIVGVDDVFYCTREDVKQALDVAETARSSRQIDRTIRSASRMIDGQMGRRFFPVTTTCLFDWPPLPYNGAFPWRLWLDENEVQAVTTLTAGGVVIPAANFFLEPVNTGPPYSHIDINLGSNSAFGSGATFQQSTAVAGVFGYTQTVETSGALSAAMTDTTGTTVTVTDSSRIGVGSQLIVDTERMLVTNRTMVTTGQTLQTPIDNNRATVILAVTDGTKYDIDEILLLDAERMLIVDIAANNLIVKRQWDGSVLAPHTGSTVYSLRQLTVKRGVLGTTAATHLINAVVSVGVIPGGIRTLCVAESMTELLNEEAGYARTVGSGESTRNASGQQLSTLWSKAITTYSRKARVRSI
jgi:hypothetical protein